jgi:ABC-2 type transport system ATP-binding protein
MPDVEVLSIRGLCRRFGDKEVLRDLSLTVPAHSVFGFVGRNGAGKTTTMRAVLGLLRVDAGEIEVMGERVCFGQTPTNRHVGYLPDVPAFYSFLTAREYLALCGESIGMERSDIRTRSGELLELVGLAGERHRIGGYSRGMKQRLGIAQALLHRPKLLLCDEPTSALDPIGRREILDLLQAVREETTVLFSTHILSDVERICTDAAILHNGAIAAEGSIEALRSMRGGEELTVELADPADVARLCAILPALARREDGTLALSGDERAIFELLTALSAHQIVPRRIERAASSLESLFLEVTSK